MSIIDDGGPEEMSIEWVAKGLAETQRRLSRYDRAIELLREILINSGCSCFNVPCERCKVEYDEIEKFLLDEPALAARKEG